MSKTREQWLEEAVNKLVEMFFTENGYEITSKLKVSCGFPKGSPKAIGQCFDPEVAKDGTTHIFICPTQDNPIRVLDILLHELVHACVGVKEGHKGAFRKMIREFGLVGKPTATFAEVESELWHKLNSLSYKLGAYPHVAMDLRGKKKNKKPTNNWVRLKSTENEEYTVVISPKKLEEFGYPMDPWGNEMISVE